MLYSFFLKSPMLDNANKGPVRTQVNMEATSLILCKDELRSHMTQGNLTQGPQLESLSPETPEAHTLTSLRPGS